jgi:hypothetical protein
MGNVGGIDAGDIAARYKRLEADLRNPEKAAAASAELLALEDELHRVLKIDISSFREAGAQRVEAIRAAQQQRSPAREAQDHAAISGLTPFELAGRAASPHWSKLPVDKIQLRQFDGPRNALFDFTPFKTLFRAGGESLTVEFHGHPAIQGERFRVQLGHESPREPTAPERAKLRELIQDPKVGQLIRSYAPGMEKAMGLYLDGVEDWRKLHDAGGLIP